MNVNNITAAIVAKYGVPIRIRSFFSRSLMRFQGFRGGMGVLREGPVMIASLVRADESGASVHWQATAPRNILA
jgi:hypothetical protein